MTSIVQSPAAERDLEDIWLAIASDSPRAATKVLRAIAARIHRLGEHPRLGPRRPDVAPSARMLVEGPYIILFRTDPDADHGRIDLVEIMRVVDGRRDLKALI